MHRVLIVNSPLFRAYNSLYDEDSLPPIGLGYIATALAHSGVRTQVLDAVASRIPLASLIQLVKEHKPDILATNIFTTNYGLVRELIESIDRWCSQVIIGGLSTRTLYPYIFDWDYSGQLDVVFGDGELITPDLVHEKLQQKPEEFRKNRRYFKIDTSSPYFVRDISAVPLDRSFLVNEPIHHPRGYTEANIVASRGCIYNCAFCAAARSLNGDLAIRERSTASLVNELSDIAMRNEGISSIRVLDDLFLKGPRCIERAIDVFGQFKFYWRSMAHVNTFTGVSRQKLNAMRLSGCAELFIGIESGSPRILKSIHKTHDLGRIRENLSNVFQAGIPVKGYFIYGFPGETEQDFEMTYRLAVKLKETALAANTRFRASVFQFRPYHGTEIFHRLNAEGVGTTEIVQVEGNSNLSSLIGRLQFNFHSGNYSAAPIEVMQNYIHRTMELNSAADWGIR